MVESAGDTLAVRYESHWKYFVNPELFARLNNITADTERTLQMMSFGLMQVMGGVARELGYRRNLLSLTDPVLAIDYGCRKLAQLKGKYNTTDDIIAAYNAGSPRKNGGLYVNQAYVDKVRGFMNERNLS
jgi:hypothetical protein